MRNHLLAGAFGIWALLVASGALANGYYQMVKGDVRAAVGTGSSASVRPGQRFQPGTSISTGAKSQAILRFDDGQTIVLDQNTDFRLDGYNFNRAKPQEDNIAMQILKGALRSVTGLIGQRSRSRFTLVAPQATIGVRGTDFMFALTNPQGYVSVLQGSVGVTNSAGSVAFGAGQIGSVASATTLATTITAAGLPASVSAAFSSLSAANIALGASAFGAGGGAGTGAGAAAGAGTASVVGSTAAAIAVGVAGVVSATNKNNTVSNH